MTGLDQRETIDCSKLQNIFFVPYGQDDPQEVQFPDGRFDLLIPQSRRLLKKTAERSGVGPVSAYLYFPCRSGIMELTKYTKEIIHYETGRGFDKNSFIASAVIAFQLIGKLIPYNNFIVGPVVNAALLQQQLQRGCGRHYHIRHRSAVSAYQQSAHIAPRPGFSPS